MSDDLKKLYLELCQDILKLNHSYYINNQSLISDFEYDLKFQRLLEIEKANPDWVTPSSPSQNVGFKPLTAGKIKHDKAMLSLSNVFNQQQLISFFSKSGSDQTFSVEPKLDGLSLSLVFDGGLLKKAITRGDGQFGQDVTHNISLIKNIPHSIPFQKKVIFYGECVMHLDDFKSLNDSSPKKLSSPRNAASGSLMLKQTELANKRVLHFYGYDLHSQFLKLSTQKDILDFISRSGFQVSSYFITTDPSKPILEIETRRSNFPFDIDGAVIKLNDLSLRTELGFTSRFPRWATAFKFYSEQAPSELFSCEWQITRAGKLRPVGVIKEVTLKGAKINKVSLHNLDYIKSKNILLGSKVWIERSGDVIPKISRVETTNKSTPIEPPKFCPSCGNLLSYSQLYPSCNSSDCKSKLVHSFTYFFKAIGFTSLGYERVLSLYESEAFYDIESFFSMSFDQITSCPGFSKLSADKLLNQIHSFRASIDLGSLLTALQIPGLGKSKSNSLAQNLKSDNPLYFDFSSLSIEGFASGLISNLELFFADPPKHLSLPFLFSGDLNISSSTLSKESHSLIAISFSGKTIINRKQLREHPNFKSNYTESSFSKNTQILISDQNTNKTLKAKEWKIQILSSSSFSQLLDHK